MPVGRIGRQIRDPRTALLLSTSRFVHAPQFWRSVNDGETGTRRRCLDYFQRGGGRRNPLRMQLERRRVEPRRVVARLPRVLQQRLDLRHLRWLRLHQRLELFQVSQRRARPRLLIGRHQAIPSAHGGTGAETWRTTWWGATLPVLIVAPPRVRGGGPCPRSRANGSEGASRFQPSIPSTCCSGV